MNTVELGGTGLEITRVGFGAWAIGGAEYDCGWGAQDDEDSIAASSRSLASAERSRAPSSSFLAAAPGSKSAE